MQLFLVFIPSSAKFRVHHYLHHIALVKPKIMYGFIGCRLIPTKESGMVLLFVMD